MQIPFLDLRTQYLELKAEIDAAVLSTLDSGWYILGERCRKFEGQFKNYLVDEKQGYVVGCNSGTDAIVLSLLAAGVKPGDEVITVANTAIPTVTAICSIGASPVFCDVDNATWLMDPNCLQSLMSKKTKAVLPVHLYGNVADMVSISSIAAKHGLAVVEDVAQACGAEWEGRKAGTLGRFGAFSFYPSKNLGAMGDGGAVFCSNSGDYEKLLMLRNYGQRDRYNAEAPDGVNSRLDELQAAALSVKLPHVDRWNSKKLDLANQYRMALGKHIPQSCFQKATLNAVPAWHLMVIRLPKGELRREELVAGMAKEGVQLLIHYPFPIHTQRAFAHFKKQDLPITDVLCAEVVSLPLHPYLEEATVVEIAATFVKFLK